VAAGARSERGIRRAVEPGLASRSPVPKADPERAKRDGMVELNGIEPSRFPLRGRAGRPSRVLVAGGPAPRAPRRRSTVRSCAYSDEFEVAVSTGGAERDRTVDLLNAIQALSQLSYSPTVGGRAG
jgi:hypothetical protein